MTTGHRLVAPQRNPWATMWLWLLLAMIAGFALMPTDSPEEPRSGSAFSATTVEVSLGATRAAELEAPQSQIDPSGPPAPLLVATQPGAPAIATAVTYRPTEAWPQAPPVRSGETKALAFDARGPPRP